VSDEKHDFGKNKNLARLTRRVHLNKKRKSKL